MDEKVIEKYIFDAEISFRETRLRQFVDLKFNSVDKNIDFHITYDANEDSLGILCKGPEGESDYWVSLYKLEDLNTETQEYLRSLGSLFFI